MRTISSAASPYCSRSCMARMGGSWYWDKNAISRRSPMAERKDWAISRAFWAVMPFRAFSSSGDCSSTSSVRGPNRSTIRRAVAGPTPLHTPEERKLQISSSSWGSSRSTSRTESCSPCWGWVSHTPEAVRCSPGAGLGMHPTTVSSSPSSVSRRSTA